MGMTRQSFRRLVVFAMCAGSMLAADRYPVRLAAQTPARAAAQPSKAPPKEPATFGIGRAASPEEIAALDIDIGSDGKGLPLGRGTSAEGASIFAARCAGCHGKTGKEGPNDV